MESALPSGISNVSSYNEAVANMRQREYPMLQDATYLDHAGAALYSKSLMDEFAAEMTSTLFGNPHSASVPSQSSTSRIENIRLRLLSFFHADPCDFDLIFVANATAGVRLVTEGFRTQPRGFHYAYHQACHTSLVGIRGEATKSTCLDDAAFDSWTQDGTHLAAFSNPESPTLVAYTAQSHMDGRRYPLSWSKSIKDVGRVSSDARVFTLLDAASFVATSPLDLSKPDTAPDFTVLSLYKIFGFPDLGALIVRREAENIFDFRKYFGGGTVDLVLCGKEEWQVPKSESLHDRLEDGTLPFHNILALDIALTVHQRLFGSMMQVKEHTENLSLSLRSGLRDMLHGNGTPVCIIYPSQQSDILPSTPDMGPVVSFNIKNSAGAWVSLVEFEKLAAVRKFHLRTGAMCSPGGISSALNLEPWEMKRNFSNGLRCGSENDIMGGKPTGVIRVSLGAMSTMSDVEKFLAFVQEFFVEAKVQGPGMLTREVDSLGKQPSLSVKTITVYPIKSCGGFVVPAHMPWEIRSEGLAWDREWCLVHAGTGQALSQKRYPKMALLRPVLDFETGFLRVDYKGTPRKQVSVPLSNNPALFDKADRQMASRVCGDKISAHRYISAEINGFFSEVLNVPCVLSRFPPGGQGSSSRSSKARMQSHQLQKHSCRLPGAFPDIPSPPESDSEQPEGSKILLSNESPILMIHESSVEALNRDIMRQGDPPVDAAVFRANIVVDSSNLREHHPPFSEDTWRSLHIGQHNFKLLGACQRCQMVCVDQSTGEKRQEPFTTLSKTRRFGGKVYFGSHMALNHKGRTETNETQHPVIQVGDTVWVDLPSSPS
ncbi:unnamed protein product [Clonostachys rhizophaga]|uniref:Molybdenum cofactor sulfurase n=1 Tax=Clonostachys rhizophaga TaxID=160324 RepID=A0A9N9VSB9_9HYPO|nr:unnamed protein product [Clonostachys rhizophaga]